MRRLWQMGSAWASIAHLHPSLTMIAAYPAVNLEPSCYTALHQQSNDDNPITQDSSSPSSASDFPYSVAMAYSQCEANNHLSPPFRQLGEDKDRKQCVRLPSTEDSKLQTSPTNCLFFMFLHRLNLFVCSTMDSPQLRFNTLMFPELFFGCRFSFFRS